MNRVVFHGVRGSIACPGDRHQRYGGNTACVEVLADQRRLVFDAGTGIRALGEALLEGGAIVDLDIFLSHGHIDHVCGIPFFRPLFERGHKVRIHGPQDPKRLIGALMRHPLYPINTSEFRCDIRYSTLAPGQRLRLSPALEIETIALDHPGGAMGYRLECAGRRLVYASDLEHGNLEFEARLIDFAKDAELLIYDAMYDARDFERVRGFGHSTWQKGAEIAMAAGAKTYIAFHHDPNHDDERLDRIAGELLKINPRALIAREGLALPW